MIPQAFGSPRCFLRKAFSAVFSSYVCPSATVPRLFVSLPLDVAAASAVVAGPERGSPVTCKKTHPSAGGFYIYTLHRWRFGMPIFLFNWVIF